MSDRIVRSVNETNGRDSQVVQSYQSIWMSHWRRTTCNTTIQTHYCNSNVVGELDYSAGKYNSSNQMTVSRSVDGRGEMETKSFKILNESLRTSSESLRKEGLEFQDFSMAGQANGGSSSLFKHGQDTDYMQALRPVSGSNYDCAGAVDCKLGIHFPLIFPGISAANEISYGGCHNPDEGTSKNSPEYMRTQSGAKDCTFAASKPLQESFIKTSLLAAPSTSENEKYEFEKGKMSVPSLIGKSAIISNHLLSDANLRNLEHEYHHNHSQSEDLVCEGYMDCHSQLESSVNALSKESHTSLLFHAPSTNNHNLSALNREWFQRMQKCSSIRLFPSQFIGSEKTEFKKSLYDCYSLRKVPKCVSDVETMRICTNVDFVGEPGAGGYPRFSHTVHSLLFTEKTDVNLSKGNVIFRGTTVLGNTPNDLHSPYPFHDRGKKGLKLQSLGNSNYSEGKENFEYFKTPKVTIKNESSAETDSMYINSFKEKNPQPGAHSNPSNEAISVDWNFSLGIAVPSSKQAGCQYPNTELPDINLPLPTLPSAVTLTENAGPISSSTRCLEMDILLAHVEHPKPPSILSFDGSPVADPSNRWVKRLKLSSSPSSSQGTKSSNMTAYPPREEMNKFFSRILNSGSTRSEPTAMKPCGKESIASDQRRYLSKEDNDFSTNPTNKGNDLLLSHAWIQRLLHNRSCITQKKSETMLFYQPQNSKLALEELHKELFPSIAAIALMGRAVSGFQPCQLHRKGSFTVWNT